jgi:uncharacterized membrane protein
MSWPTAIGALIVAAGIACGQILLKLAAQALPRPGNLTLSSILEIFLNPYLIAACLVVGLTTLIWMWVLSMAELSKVYPLVALTFVFVPLASIFFFKEESSIALWAGSFLIIAGVYIIARYA